MRRIAVDGGGGGGAEVERCDHCGAAFFEYFDGEPSALARGLEVEETPDTRLPGTVADPRCPDCDTGLVLARYLTHGPDLWRCGGCLAAFATAPQIQALARFALVEESPEDERSWWSRLLDRLLVS